MYTNLSPFQFLVLTTKLPTPATFASFLSSTISSFLPSALHCCSLNLQLPSFNPLVGCSPAALRAHLWGHLPDPSADTVPCPRLLSPPACFQQSPQPYLSAIL